MYILLAGIPASGDNEIRTHDPLLARQVLSQLSYTPGFQASPALYVTKDT